MLSFVGSVSFADSGSLRSHIINMCNPREVWITGLALLVAKSRMISRISGWKFFICVFMGSVFAVFCTVFAISSIELHCWICFLAFSSFSCSFMICSSGDDRFKGIKICLSVTSLLSSSFLSIDDVSLRSCSLMMAYAFLSLIGLVMSLGFNVFIGLRNSFDSFFNSTQPISPPFGADGLRENWLAKLLNAFPFRALFINSFASFWTFSSSFAVSMGRIISDMYTSSTPFLELKCSRLSSISFSFTVMYGRIFFCIILLQAIWARS